MFYAWVFLVGFFLNCLSFSIFFIAGYHRDLWVQLPKVFLIFFFFLVKVTFVISLKIVKIDW